MIVGHSCLEVMSTTQKLEKEKKGVPNGFFHAHTSPFHISLSPLNEKRHSKPYILSCNSILLALSLVPMPQLLVYQTFELYSNSTVKTGNKSNPNYLPTRLMCRLSLRRLVPRSTQMLALCLGLIFPLSLGCTCSCCLLFVCR